VLLSIARPVVDVLQELAQLTLINALATVQELLERGVVALFLLLRRIRVTLPGRAVVLVERLLEPLPVVQLDELQPLDGYRATVHECLAGLGERVGQAEREIKRQQPQRVAGERVILALASSAQDLALLTPETARAELGVKLFTVREALRLLEEAVELLVVRGEAL
jgi:hypothetical protein